jgi:hypothetical protein
VLLDTRGAKVSPGRWHGRQFRIDLIEDAEGNWFSGFYPFDAAVLGGNWDCYCAPPGERYAFLKLTVLEALLLCGPEDIPEPPNLVAAYEASKSAPPLRTSVPAPHGGHAADNQDANTDNQDANKEARRTPDDPEPRDNEAVVSDFLRPYRKLRQRVTARAVWKKTRIPEGTIKGLRAWKDYRADVTPKKSPSADAMPRARQLPDGAELLIPGNATDPAMLAETKEAEEIANRIRTEPEYRALVEREFLENEDIPHSMKVEYHKSSDDAKCQRLMIWKALGIDDLNRR